jgi:hydrogenase maturation protein HypF
MQIACDAHPDYLSTRFAEECGLPVTRVQHHHAHVLACMSEHGLRGPVLGVCWDGTGYGGDGTAWGGEFLRVDGAIFERRAHLRCFPLAGGDQAAREPRRAALGVLFALYGKALFDRCNLPLLRDFTPTELQVLEGMLTGRVRSPFTSSAGRLFDAVSALIGRCSRATFEGQAAMQLEFAAEEARTEATYPFTLLAGDRGAECPILDWGPAIYAVLADLQGQLPATDIAAKFHNTLAEMIVTVAAHVAEERVVLTGGCFQNRYLTECSVNRLRAAGFQPYWHQWVPPNDGGIAVGQALAVALRAAEE